MSRICLALALATSFTASGAYAGADEMALCTRMAAAWRQAFNANAADKVAAMYEETGSVYSNPFYTASGRPAIEAGLKHDLALGTKYDSITCDAAESAGSLLVVHGTFAGSAMGPGGKAMPLSGHWAGVARHAGETYLITDHTANVQLPAPR